MTLQDVGALGEAIGAIAVVVSLIYVAYQIRQSSHQLELNSRNIQASMYHATNDNFFRWFSLLAQDQELAGLWLRALQGEPLPPEERTRFNALAATLFLAYESNFEQLRLGTLGRNSLALSAPQIARMFASPHVGQWWQRHAPTTLTPEFRAEVERVRDVAGRDDQPGA